MFPKPTCLSVDPKRGWFEELLMLNLVVVYRVVRAGNDLQDVMDELRPMFGQ